MRPRAIAGKDQQASAKRGSLRAPCREIERYSRLLRILFTDRLVELGLGDEVILYRTSSSRQPIFARYSNIAKRLELDLPSSTSARFDVSTYSGSIHNELGPPAKKTGRYTPGKELKFTLGGGDGRVRVENFSGSISLRRR